MTSSTSHRTRAIRIWDLPLRLFHWLLTLCVVGAFVTAQLGGLWMDVHVRFGIATLGLLIFRLIWGLIGPYHARFGNFVRGPAAMLHYVRGRHLSAGHSPIGAAATLLLLLSLLVQVSTGLFANDGILIEGPLAHWVSGATSDTLTAVHHINKIVLLVLVILHLLAIAWYTLVRRQPLVRAMITGNKPAGQVPERTPPSDDDWRIALRAAVIAGLVAAVLAGWLGSAL